MLGVSKEITMENLIAGTMHVSLKLVYCEENKINRHSPLKLGLHKYTWFPVWAFATGQVDVR